jgi:hypothetical protein
MPGLRFLAARIRGHREGLAAVTDWECTEREGSAREEESLTVGPEIRLLCSPHLQIQACDFLEVRVARHEGHTMLHCDSSDPDIILWNRPAFLAQVILDHTVMSCGAGIARKHCRTLSELIDLRDVLRDAFRLLGAILELTENDCGNENLLSFDEMIDHRFRLCEQGNDDIRVEKESTTHRD